MGPTGQSPGARGKIFSHKARAVELEFESFRILSVEGEFLRNLSIHVQDSVVKPMASCSQIALVLRIVKAQQFALPFGLL